MNLQQLRYLVTTADEGTMTRAAASLHVAQPALSRAIRGLESEIGITVFERKGRGVRVSRQGREVVSVARRILTEVDRLSSLGEREVLRVCAVRDQAPEVGTPTVAAFVAAELGRVALDVADVSSVVVDQVRNGRAHLGIIELPAPPDLWATSLGWQELVLLHPPDWELDDPLDARELSQLPLLAPASDDWRHAALIGNLRTLGVSPNITAEVSGHDLLTALVLKGAGAWFSCGQQAEDAEARGAGVVRLDPAAVREIGIVAAARPGRAAQAFIDVARAETGTRLLPAGDPLLERATWISGAEIVGPPPSPPRPASARTGTSPPT